MSTGVQQADVPPVTKHAADRWDQRTAPDSVAPETAWEHAQRITVPGPVVRADEVRLHGDTGALLLRRGPCIATVLTVTEASDELSHAIEHALPADCDVGDHQ